jgi:hypothetical protein
MFINERTFFGRQPVEDGLDIGVDVGELIGLQYAFEDVEAAAPVGIEDILGKFAVGVETDGAAIAQCEGPALTLAQIGLHCGFLGTVPGRRACQHRAHGDILVCLHSRSGVHCAAHRLSRQGEAVDR